MKKPHVLNRPMFNQGGNSAYGKGITSNLVSDEQRQRFNYGGRVGYQNRGLVNPYLNEQDWYNYDKKPWDTIERTIPIKSDLYSTASSQTNDDVMNEWGPLVEGVEVEDLFPSLGSGKKQVKKDKTAQERFESAQERFYPQEILEAEVKEKIPPPPPDLKTDPYSDRIDIMEELRDIYKPTEEDIKARQTGRAFKAMGTLGKLAFTPWKTKAFGEALGAEGESWAKEAEKDIEDKKTMKILMGQAVGKRVGAEEKGKQARLTAEAKTAPSTAKETYDASIALVLAKDPTPSEGDIAAAFWNATRVTPKVLKKGKKKEDLEANEAMIAEADEDDVFLLDKQWYKKKGTGIIKISEETALKLKG